MGLSYIHRGRAISIFHSECRYGRQRLRTENVKTPLMLCMELLQLDTFITWRRCVERSSRQPAAAAAPQGAGSSAGPTPGSSIHFFHLASHSLRRCFRPRVHTCAPNWVSLPMLSPYYAALARVALDPPCVRTRCRPAAACSRPAACQSKRKCWCTREASFL